MAVSLVDGDMTVVAVAVDVLETLVIVDSKEDDIFGKAVELNGPPWLPHIGVCGDADADADGPGDGLAVVPDDDAVAIMLGSLLVMYGIVVVLLDAVLEGVGDLTKGLCVVLLLLYDRTVS